MNAAPRHPSLGREPEEEPPYALSDVAWPLVSALGDPPDAASAGISDGFIAVDDEWRLTHIHVVAKQIWSRQADELIGTSIFRNSTARSADWVQAAYVAAKDAGHMVAFSAHSPVLDAWFEVRGHPHASGYTIFFRDVTEARASHRVRLDGERQREIARSINQRIFDTSQDLILVVDRKGEFVRVSPSSRAILGYRPEEMVGRSAADFVYPADLEGTRTEMRLARHGRRMRNFDCRYLHKEGYVVPLAWMGAWSEPEQQHFFIGRDMTERMAAEEQLRQAQKMEAVGQLTGGVAHDFNNLLTVILGNAEMAQEKLEGQEAALSLVRMIESAAHRGAELTRRLLAFSRRQALRPTNVNLNALVGEMETLLHRALGEEIEIRASLEPSLWTAMVDAAQVENALLNLAVNARDAMPNGGKLSIETANSRLDEETIDAYRLEAVPGDYVALSVADTGVGMPAEVLKRAFEPFFTTKPVGKGTGLGLSMIYGFVKQSGGFVKIYSEPNQGTMVKLYLPRTKDPVADAPRGKEAESGDLRGRECILVVEDDDLVRNYVVSRLDGLGYRVLEAEDGKGAVALIEKGLDVDLLFTDVVLPEGLNGRQLADEARRLRPDVKILFTSGYTQETMVHHGKLDPGIALLNKPYRREDLARKIRQILDAPAQPLVDQPQD